MFLLNSTAVHSNITLQVLDNNIELAIHTDFLV